MVQYKGNAFGGGGFWWSRVGSDDAERVAVLEEAHGTLGNRMGGNQVKGERLYKNFYEDLMANESQWFDVILGNPYNISLMDGAIVVLGTLTTIFRNRPDMKMTGAVFPIYERVLNIYSTLVANRELVDSFSSNVSTIESNCAGLVYKFDAVKMNFTTMKYKEDPSNVEYKNIMTTSFRALIHYEIESNKLNQDDIMYASMLTMRLDRKPTLADLASLNDAKIWAMLQEILAMENDDEPETAMTKQAQLKRCDFCAMLEDSRGEFMKCGRCKGVFYCDAACQKMSWKTHKKVCVAKT